MSSRWIHGFAALAVVLALAFPAGAQFGGHYPAGAEGVKGASLPPPGAYLRDYNFYYNSDELKNGPPNFDVTAVVIAPRLIWMTGQTVLGATYGMDVIVPLVYTDLTAGPFDDSSTGIGDVQFEPLLLAWHGKQWDVGAGYAVWAPVGDFELTEPDSPGKGFWSHMFTLGATVFPDNAKRLSLSALNRYEIHTEVEDTDITPGDTYTLDAGIGYGVKQTLEIGVSGYLQRQVTDDSGAGASDRNDRVYAAGPEIGMVFPKPGIMASLRYLREFSAKDRPEGDTAVLTLTHRF